MKRKIAKINQYMINIIKASTKIPKNEWVIKKVNFGKASSMLRKGKTKEGFRC